MTIYNAKLSPAEQREAEAEIEDIIALEVHKAECRGWRSTPQEVGAVAAKKVLATVLTRFRPDLL